MNGLKLGLAAATAAATIGAATSAFAATEIQFWHAMTGELLTEQVEKFADRYNQSQDEYKIVPVYKGNYTETLTAAIAAFRAGEQPAIVQVFEVGTATMMNAEGAIYPVYELMEATGKPFNPDIYLDAVKSYYTTSDGKMLSMPFNSSTPVVFYNKDAFEKAGLDPNDPPKTWEGLVEASRKIMGVEGNPTCGFTTGYQSWVQLENFGALHDVPFATKANGFGGVDTELAFNQEPFTTHIQNMQDWQEDRVFVYGGRRGEPNPLFLSGECAMLMNSSAYYTTIEEGAGFEWGVAPLPYYEGAEGAPQNSIIGGATLWVLQGHDEETYEGVAEFLNFLSQPEMQVGWHKATGYVPITVEAYEMAKEEGFYEQNPGADVAINQLTMAEPTENSKGLRLGNFTQIRDVINSEMEKVWSGDKNAEQALDTAVEEGNKLLRKFEQSVN